MIAHTRAELFCVLQELATATATATARVAVAVSSHAVNALKGRASYIRGSGTRTERVDERTGLCVLRKLCRECRVFSLQTRYFLLREEIKYRVCAVTLTVDDVSRAGIDGVSNIARVLREIVINTVNSTLGLTATILLFIAELTNSVLYAVLRLHNSGVYAAETLTQRLLYARLTEFKVVERGQSGVLCKANRHVVARRNLAEFVVQIAAVRAAAETPAVAEKRKKQDYPNPISAPSVAPAVVGVALTDCISFCKSVIHFFVLLVCFFISTPYAR